MKKSLWLLSIMSLALTACSSNNHSDTTSTSADVIDASTAWQTDVQPTSMPASMSQPTYQAPSYQAPNYQTPSYNVPQPLPAYGSSTETIGNCQVVRDSEGKPLYAQIQKGCYSASQYTVGAKDTLYLIGYLTGTNADYIAQLNGLDPQAKLAVGKVLRVR